MPTPAYMSIQGETQGEITADTFTEKSVGNIWQEGHENEILVQAFKHVVTTPTDPQSGQRTGQRVHKPLVVTKVYDKSSPLLYKALTTGENLPTVLIRWFRTAADGTSEEYFKHVLEDAKIVNIEAYMPNCQDPGQAHFTHLEDVSFTYRKIRWEHIVASTDHEDDWRTAVTT